MRTPLLGSSLLSLAAMSFALVAGCAEGGTSSTDGAVADASRDGGGGDGGAGGEDGGGAPDGGAVDAGPRAVTIFAIQDPEHADHVPAGTNVRVEDAIVAAVDAFAENAAGTFVGDVWIADGAGGPFSGVHVYMPAHAPCAGRSALGLGDVVTVEGTVQEFAVPSDGSGRTVTQIVSGTVTCTAPGDGVGPAAERIADPAELTDDATAEPWEGVLVELSDVEASGDPDAFGVLPLRVGPPVDDDLFRHPGSRRDRFVTLRGVFHYMFGRWLLDPRRAEDVVLGAPRTLEDESGAWGCGDAEDSDGDGAIDCDDADCAGSPFCAGITVTVQDLQDETRAAHPAPGASVAIAGAMVVTAIDTFAEMAGPGYTGTVVVQDPAATDARFSGVHVFVPTVEACGSALAVGDRVYVAGRYEEYAASGDTGGTLTEILDGIVSCRMPGAPIAPTEIAPAELATAAAAEPWEGVLVELRDVAVTMPPGTYGRFQVSGGAYVDDDLHRVAVVAGDRLTRVAGIVTYQFEPQLEPRSADDVVIAPSERDDASCGNGIDDDGDGVADCSDLDCCATAPCAGAVAGRDLILSEVLYDATAGDEGREWIELRNAGTTAVPLACYAMGSGGTSYTYSRAQLPAIVVPPGGCVVIGGPDCGGTACTADLNFDPDILNGAAATAQGVGIFYARSGDITATSVPLDAVLYGAANTAMLRDGSGSAPLTAHVPDVASGHSVARDATGGWIDRASPDPGTCTTFTP